MKEKNTLASHLHFNTAEREKFLALIMITHVAPGLRALVEEAAKAVTAEFEPGIYNEYIAQELILQSLTDWLTLTALDPYEAIRPAMLQPEFVLDWFDPNGRNGVNPKGAPYHE